MKRTALLRNIPEQAPPMEESTDVVAVSQIISYDGQQYLNMTCFTVAN